MYVTDGFDPAGKRHVHARHRARPPLHARHYGDGARAVARIHAEDAPPPCRASGGSLMGPPRRCWRGASERNASAGSGWTRPWASHSGRPAASACLAPKVVDASFSGSGGEKDWQYAGNRPPGWVTATTNLLSSAIPVGILRLHLCALHPARFASTPGQKPRPYQGHGARSTAARGYSCASWASSHAARFDVMPSTPAAIIRRATSTSSTVHT